MQEILLIGGRVVEELDLTKFILALVALYLFWQKACGRISPASPDSEPGREGSKGSPLLPGLTK